MPILTRSVCEFVMIGDDIAVTVMGGGVNQVRVVIAAPQAIKVHREEIFKGIKRDEKAAGCNQPS